MIVVDTNVISHFLIPGPLSELAKRASRQDVWCAPILWRSEFRNVLATHLRAGLLDCGTIRILLDKAERLMWGREFSVRSSSVIACIEKSKQSAYDCEFVALAQDLGLRLVTTDEPVAAEFPATAILLRDFVSGS